MSFPNQIAKHLREVYSGGNWTGVNLKDTLADVNWEMAAVKVNSFNSITALVYHMNYYVRAAIQAFEESKLDASDKFSFDHPPINSDEDWRKLTEQVFADAEHLAELIEQMPEEKLDEIFIDTKYGTYFRNLVGTIEHFHYHLGQIVLIKKLLKKE